MTSLGRLIVMVVVVFGAAVGFVTYEWYLGSMVSSVGRSAKNSNLVLDKRASLNETYDQYNPYDPYPFESVSYSMQLLSGTYELNVHTSGTVYVYVKLDGCYDETLYHCTRLQEGFTTSESPPNVATFAVTQNGRYTLTVSLQQIGSLREACGSAYEPACPVADLEIIVSRV